MRLIGRLNRVLWGLNLALLAVVVLTAAVFLAPDRSERHAAVATLPAGAVKGPQAVEQKAQSNIDPKLILDRDIFGAGPGAVAGGPAKPEAAASERPKPEIKHELPLRLLGTVVDEKGASFAVLENLATKAQDIYRVGDAIGDARIDGIEQNKIVVVSMGVRETLSIALTARDVPTTVVASQAPAAEPPKKASDEVVKLVSDSERQINVSASGESLGRAAQFLSKLRLSPHVTDGRSDGLRISGLGDSAVAQLVGLRDGDVVQVINGHVVSDQQKASQVLRKARMLGSADIELMRGQERKSLAFRAGSW
jgi:type II secretion system protein C